MIYLINFINENFIFLFLVVATLIMLCANVIRNKYQKNIFGLFLVTSIIFIINSYLIKSIFIDDGTYRLISLFINYSFEPIIILLFILFISNNFNKKEIVLTILSIINFILCLNNLLFPNIFNINNICYSSFGLSCILIIILIIEIYKKAKCNRFNCLTISLVTFIFFGGAIILEYYYNKYNLLNETIFISAVFYYFYLRSSFIERDSLTNLLNKSSFIEDGEKYGSLIKAVVSIGLNNLSEINKTKGYNAGNKALITVAKYLAKHSNNDIISYRVGSSEFALYFLKNDDNDILLFMKKLYKDLLKHNYCVSIECVYNNNNINVDELYKIAFNKMENQRNEYYQIMNKDR